MYIGLSAPCFSANSSEHTTAAAAPQVGGQHWKRVKGGWADLRSKLLKDEDLLREYVRRLDGRFVKSAYTRKGGDDEGEEE